MADSSAMKAGTGSELWRPVLPAPLALLARGAIVDILRELEAWPLEQPGLAAGLAGQAIGYEYLARAVGEAGPGTSDGPAQRIAAPSKSALDERARRAWDGADDAIANSASAPWFYGGFPGIAWAGAHLAARRLFEFRSASPFEEIDAALLSYLESMGRFGSLDLVAGVTGIGLYALERLPDEAGRRILERVVTRLEEAAAPFAGHPGRAWLTPSEALSPHQRALAPHGHFNLGVAHGIPAITALLAAVSAAGIAQERAGGLADDGLAWIWSQESQRSGETRFPAWIAVGDEPRRPSRIGWCYGDLGMSLALLLAARARGNSEWVARAVDLARHAAGIVGVRSGVRDAGLCHGSAGNALLFARLAHLTGCEVLEDAARYWAAYALAHRQVGAIAGFPVWHARDPVAGVGWGYLPDAGLLTGAMGVAASLAALITDVEPVWDRFLVASLPDPTETA